jgi:hypothetical protein
MQDRDTYRAWSFVTIDLSEIEAKQPRDVIQNLLREIRRISDQRPSYFGAYVAKAGAEHLHLALNIAPGTLAWNALDAWAERQNGKWPSRVRFEEITCDKGGLAGLIAYLIGRKNLNRHPGRIMRSNDLIKAVTALAATIPAKARRSAADASEAFQGPHVAPDLLQGPVAPSQRPDAIDHPPAESTRPAGDRTDPQETGIEQQDIEGGDLTLQKFSPILSTVNDRQIIQLDQYKREFDVIRQAQDHSRTAFGSSAHLGGDHAGDPFGRISCRCIRSLQANHLVDLRRHPPARRQVHRSRDPPPADMGRGSSAQGPSDRRRELETRRRRSSGAYRPPLGRKLRRLCRTAPKDRRMTRKSTPELMAEAGFLPGEVAASGPLRSAFCAGTATADQLAEYGKYSHKWNRYAELVAERDQTDAIERQAPDPARHSGDTSLGEALRQHRDGQAGRTLTVVRPRLIAVDVGGGGMQDLPEQPAWPKFRGSAGSGGAEIIRKGLNANTKR